MDGKRINIQSVRLELEKSDVFKKLRLLYPKSRVLIWNYWFIVVPNDTLMGVRKFYLTHEYYNIELQNHKFVANAWILVPNIISQGIQLEMNYIVFENIRVYYTSVSKITDLNAENLAKILSIIHQLWDLKTWKVLLHGNLHFSNFFHWKDWKLGIFDFMSMHQGDLEYDLANLYFYSHYDDDYLDNFLRYYSLSNRADYKKIYLYTILRIKDSIKYNIYIDSYGKKMLRLDLLLMKKKIWSIK